MRTADYKCKDCGAVIERVFDGSAIPPTIHAPHDHRYIQLACLPPRAKVCSGELSRHYASIAIGAGTSGGTPARS